MRSLACVSMTIVSRGSALRRSPVLLGAGLALLIVPNVARSADCQCDHRITPDQLSINGSDLGVEAGEVLCIEGGTREFLRIYEMLGTEEAPIVIQNCEGQVVIDNSDRGYGLTLEGSRHVRVTGTGDEAVQYGFQIRASRDGPDYSASCIVAGALSTNYEIDHIEAFQCGFAGVTSKTDPTCDRQDMSDFVQYNTRLHHLYLHDTGGEGIYFGNTGYPSRTGTCDGKEVDLIPHTHEGVWIHDNIIEDTGWDGLQVGVSPKDCYVYRNRIARVGLEGVEYQTQGLQIGGGSQCEITDNFLANGPAMGIIVLDAASTSIYNNVIVDFQGGIYINDRDMEVTEGASYQVLHNTLVNTDAGITIYGQRSAGNVFVNNFLVNAGDSPLSIGSDVDALSEGNLLIDTIGEALFTDPSKDDYRIEEGSPAIDAGVDASAWGVGVDQLGAPRDERPDPGAFEYGAEAPDNPVSPPGPGENPSPPAKEGEEAGCSCRSAPSRSSPWSLLALLGLAGARRRRRALTTP